MAVWNPTNPVDVGVTAKASQYKRVFDNALALQEGSKELDLVRIGEGGAPTPASGEATIYADSTSHRALLSENGGPFLPILTEGGLPVYDLGGQKSVYQEGDAYPTGPGLDALAPGTGLWVVDPDALVGNYGLRVLMRVDIAGAVGTVALVDLAAPDTALTGSEVNGSAGETVGEVVESGAITLPAGGSEKQFGVKVKTANPAHKVSVWQVQIVRL